MRLEVASDIKKKVGLLVKKLEISHIDPKGIYCFRSFGSKSKARARIWSLPRIWQMALGIKPGYCIEVLSEKFDKLSNDDKTKVLIHELLHIPKTFSGALLPHRSRGRVKVDGRTVNRLFKKLNSR